MTDAPTEFPQYPKPQGVQIAHPRQAKPLLKIMSRAFKGKLGKNKLFHTVQKRKKPRIV